MKIGILAIQGDYEAHAKMLDRIGVLYSFVRTPDDLAHLSAIILPGGESSTHLKILSEEGLFEALKQFAANGGAFFGTCAGAILLAREVHGPRRHLSRSSISLSCAMAMAASLPATFIPARRNC